MIIVPEGDLKAILVFYPPDKRKRDLDNLLASMKPSIDGVCEALNFDDSRIKEISVSWGKIIKGGMVTMELVTMIKDGSALAMIEQAIKEEK